MIGPASRGACTRAAYTRESWHAQHYHTHRVDASRGHSGWQMLQRDTQLAQRRLLKCLIQVRDTYFLWASCSCYACRLKRFQVSEEVLCWRWRLHSVCALAGRR